MNEAKFWTILLASFGVLFLVFFALIIGYLTWLIFNPQPPIDQLATYIRECRALEVSMETCERLAAKVLGG